MANVHHPPRAKLKTLEAFAIGSQRRIVVHAGCHVTEVRRGNGAASGFLEIHHVERFFRTGDYHLILRRLPRTGR